MRHQENYLITADELDAFLQQHRKAPCPWCGSKGWGLHSDSEKNEATTRSLPRVTMRQEGNEVKGGVDIGTAQALVVAVTECLTCGHLDFFSYFGIKNKIRDGQQVERDNGDHPSI